jgi:4-hydroxybenzoyl-CoA thioesterase
VGLDHHSVQTTYGAVGLGLVDAQASFKRPATFGDQVRAEARIVRVGKSSLTVEHRLTVGDTPIVVGREVRVWMVRDGAGVTSASIPDTVRTLLEIP